MRVLIQRVSEASILVNDVSGGSIGIGLVVLVGIEDGDGHEDITWLANKVANLRIFPDEEGVMNLSLLDIGADIMCVSQFTLLASTKKGNRPSYIRSARPEAAALLYEKFVHELRATTGKQIPDGTFGANMQVKLVNDGPVTIMIDSKNKE